MRTKPLTEDEVPFHLRQYVTFDDVQLKPYGKHGVEHLCVKVRCPICDTTRYVMTGTIRQKIKRSTWTAECRPCHSALNAKYKRLNAIHPSVAPYLDLSSLYKKENSGSGYSRITAHCAMCGQGWDTSLGRYFHRITPPLCASCAKKFREPGARTRNNYVQLYISRLPQSAQSLARQMTKGDYILAHRLVMAHHLGRALYKYEIVHHRDGQRENNEIANLELFIKGHHNGHGSYYQEWQEALSELTALRQRCGESPA